MGQSDNLIFEDQKAFIRYVLDHWNDDTCPYLSSKVPVRSRNDIRKIAHLGQPSGNWMTGGQGCIPTTEKVTFNTAEGAFECLAEDAGYFRYAHSYNKLRLQPATARLDVAFPNAKQDFYDIQLGNWDIDKKWNISGYDLVTCFRVTCFAKDKEHLLHELKECVKKNTNVIVDFVQSIDPYKTDLDISLKDLREAGLAVRLQYTLTNPIDRNNHLYCLFSEE